MVAWKSSGCQDDWCVGLAEDRFRNGMVNLVELSAAQSGEEAEE